MLAGYVTFEELKLITGFSDGFLYHLLVKGMQMHEADLYYDLDKKPAHKGKYKKMLFNLQEIEDWLRIHIF